MPPWFGYRLPPVHVSRGLDRRALRPRRRAGEGGRSERLQARVARPDRARRRGAGAHSGL